MNYVTPKDIEKINELIVEMNRDWLHTWQWVADKSGWSISTVKKYYDKDWYPGKYYQKPIQTEKINYSHQSGIYLLAQQIFENGQVINLIKVGQSTNLDKRLKSYVGMNPFAKCIATKNYRSEDLNQVEELYHNFLGIKNRRYGNTEWFICDDEQYNWWLENKLSLL